jgi:predicted nucleotidyltransferase
VLAQEPLTFLRRANIGFVDPLVDRAAQAMLASAPLQGRRVIACWAFGSRARGAGRADSDVDLAVLCEPTLGLERTRIMDIVGCEIGVDVDVIDMGSAPAVLKWEVITTGRLLVERDELAVEDFVRRARWEAEDDEQRNRMILLAQTTDAGGTTP